MYLSSFDTLGSLPSTFDRPSPLSSASSTPRSSSFGFAGSFRAPSPFQSDLPMFSSRSARTGHLEAPMDLSLPPLPPLPMPPRRRRPETLTSQNRMSGNASGSEALRSSTASAQLPPLGPLPGYTRSGLPDSPSASSFSTPTTAGMPGHQSFSQRHRRGSNASLYGSAAIQSAAFSERDFEMSPYYRAGPPSFDSFGADPSSGAGYGALPSRSASPFGNAGAIGSHASGYPGRSRKMSADYGMAGSPFDDSRFYSSGKRTNPSY